MEPSLGQAPGLPTSIRQDSKSLPRINTLAYFASTEVTKKKQHRLPEWNSSREGSLLYPLPLEQTRKACQDKHQLILPVQKLQRKSNTSYLTGALLGQTHGFTGQHQTILKKPAKYRSYEEKAIEPFQVEPPLGQAPGFTRQHQTRLEKPFKVKHSSLFCPYRSDKKAIHPTQVEPLQGRLLALPASIRLDSKSLPWINTLAYFVRTEVRKSNTAYLSGALQGRLPALPIGYRVYSKSLLRLKTLAYFGHWLSNTVSLI